MDKLACLLKRLQITVKKNIPDMKIKFLKAFDGDSIFLSFKDEGNNRNILIDGGRANTYKCDKNSKGKREYGELKEVIDNLRSKDESIDLLIITHVDADHISGILKWFDEDKEAYKLIKEVWFNSGKLIAEFFKEEENKDLQHFIDPFKTEDTNIKQGIEFSKYIEDKGILKKIIFQNTEISKFGLDFKILSPNEIKLKKLLHEWKKEEPNLNTASKNNDYPISLKEHIQNDIFKEDIALPNGSSIAFILSYNNKNFLFLGDSHPSVIINGLNNFGYCKDNPLNAEFVKVSHHGSKENTNIELLKCINSKNYVISTNGKYNQHPHKQLLARIINEKNDCNLYFNYEERIDNIFSNQDKIDFPEFKVLAITDEFEF
jgi:beta-lactamase superfamily II metal-dependent hydrolase